MIFLQLFWEFFKTGLFAVGGGLATIPFLKDITLKYPWFTPQDLLDMIAVSESTPGPMGVNSATYAGFQAAGIPGALVATCSLVLPSVIVIILVSRALNRFKDSRLVQDGFYGLRPASAGLIFGALLEVFAAALFHTELWTGLGSLGAVFNLPAIAFFLILSLAIWKLPRIHPIVFIGVGALCGIVFHFYLHIGAQRARRKPKFPPRPFLCESRRCPTLPDNPLQYRGNALPKRRFPAAAPPTLRSLQALARYRQCCQALSVHKPPLYRTAFCQLLRSW